MRNIQLENELRGYHFGGQTRGRCLTLDDFIPGRLVARKPGPAGRACGVLASRFFFGGA